MTVGELRKKIECISDDSEFVVNLAPSGHISGGGTVKVVSINHGIDWDHGKIILGTEEPVDIWYDKCKNCGIRNDGRVTSKFKCVDLDKFDFELQVNLDGKTMFKVPYNHEDIQKKK